MLFIDTASPERRVIAGSTDKKRRGKPRETPLYDCRNTCTLASSKLRPAKSRPFSRAIWAGTDGLSWDTRSPRGERSLSPRGALSPPLPLLPHARVPHAAASEPLDVTTTRQGKGGRTVTISTSLPVLPSATLLPRGARHKQHAQRWIEREGERAVELSRRYGVNLSPFKAA